MWSVWLFSLSPKTAPVCLSHPTPGDMRDQQLPARSAAASTRAAPAARVRAGRAHGLAALRGESTRKVKWFPGKGRGWVSGGLRLTGGSPVPLCLSRLTPLPKAPPTPLLFALPSRMPTPCLITSQTPPRTSQPSLCPSTVIPQ